MVYHNQSSPGSLTIDGLAPYSEQTVGVEACTRFGCTLSPLVTVRTFESGMYCVLNLLAMIIKGVFYL